MNKILSLSLTFSLAALSLTSCLKMEEENIFDKSAAERLNEASDLYSGRLEDSKGGWVMEYYPTWDEETPTGNGYLLCALFNSDGSVKMGMENTFSSNRYLEDTSAWAVITDDGPVLTFNTYNKVMHAFSNPEDVPSTSDDETGNGARGDYEFVMVDVPEGGQQIMLKGKKRGTYTRMTRLPEGTDFQEYIEDVQAFNKKVFSSAAPNFCVLTVDGDKYKTEDISTGIVKLFPYDGDTRDSESYHPFMLTKRDNKYYFRMRSEFSFTDAIRDTTSNYELQELVYDENKDIFVDENNAENTLEPEDVHDFFARSMSSTGVAWLWNANSEMSDSYATLYTDLKNAFTKVKYTLQSLSIRSVGTTYVVRVAYKAGKSNTTADYVIVPSAADGKMSFKYDADSTKDTAKKVLTALPALQTILDQLTTEPLVAESAGNKWDLSSLRLVSSSNSNMWFVVSK